MRETINKPKVRKHWLTYSHVKEFISENPKDRNRRKTVILERAGLSKNYFVAASRKYNGLFSYRCGEKLLEVMRSLGFTKEPPINISENERNPEINQEI